jgi:hypothetical protein
MNLVDQLFGALRASLWDSAKFWLISLMSFALIGTCYSIAVNKAKGKAIFARHFPLDL